MNTVINVENISKRYIISHQCQDSYGTLRDVITEKFRNAGRRIFHPFNGSKVSHSHSSTREEFWALKDVSFDIKQGDRVGIIGRNGAGKSTLLKILSRITEPTTGKIRIKGRVASLLEVGTGFHPELTGRENIFLNGAILGMTKAEITKKFDEIVAFSEVEKFLDTPVKRYSSGMYVRLAFAVAAHLEPEILIVDEVLAVGDAQFQKKCLGKMGDVAKDGRTVLFVSHNMSAVQSLCNNAVFLAGGMKIKEGNSFDVVNFYLSKVTEVSKSLQEYPSDHGREVKIRRVAVRNQRGNISDFVDLNEKFIIQIDYEFNNDLSNVSIGLTIIAEDSGHPLISLSDPELELTRLEKRSKGYYQSYVAIPAKILNTGCYRIRVGATALRNVYDVVDDVSFQVVDSVGIVQSIGYERKNSLLSMQLPWNITRLDSQPEHIQDIIKV